jgi:hypothetical protein
MHLSLELPHWLMIAGALLLVIGIVGALVSRKTVDEADTTPEGPIEAPKAKMPSLPKLLDSRGKTPPKADTR